MSYLVLARKWRPQNFDQVVGQPHVARTLQNAILAGRVAHAYLFTGARGVGKTSVARIFARALNCLEGLSVSPCGQCSNCREIAQGNSPDVLEIDGASNRGIDSIRELRETIRYRPSKSRYKIYIIDEVHMLTTEAFNALLKTLEEPPEHVLFMFATTEPHKIPSTILSRCQRFDFRRIPMPALVGHLRKIAGEERLEVSETVLYAIAREADGSMRDAQSLLEQLLAFSGDGLDDVEVLDILGVVDRRSVLRAGDAILDGDVTACLETVDAVHRRGIDTRRFCQQLCDHFRNLLFLALGEGSERLEVSAEETERLLEQVGKVTAESLLLYFQMLLKGEEDIRRSSLPKITLEMLLIRLARTPRIDSLHALLGKLDSLESLMREAGIRAPAVFSGDFPASGGRRLEPTPPGPSGSMKEVPPGPPLAGDPHREREPSPSPEPMESSPAKAEDGSRGKAALEEMTARWPDFVRRLQVKEPVLAARLDRSLVTLTEGLATVHVLEIFEAGLRSEGALSKLQKVAEEYFGVQCRWAVAAKAAEPRDVRESREQHSSRSGSKRLVLQHPVVLQALEILGGELVDIKKHRPSRKEARVGGQTGDVES